jgi:large subunit ribosomal protein L31e
MAEKTKKGQTKRETKTEKSSKKLAKDVEVDKIYTIPLRKAFRKPRTRRAFYSIRLIQDYIQRHTKKSAKLGQKLNDAIWQDGIRNPPRKIRVGVKFDGDVAKTELMGFEYKEFKAKKAKVSEGMREKLMARLSPKAMANKELEDKIEGKKPPKIAKEQAEELKEIEEEVKDETKIKDTKTKPVDRGK